MEAAICIAGITVTCDQYCILRIFIDGPLFLKGVVSSDGKLVNVILDSAHTSYHDLRRTQYLCANLGEYSVAALILYVKTEYLKRYPHHDRKEGRFAKFF